MEGEVIEGEGQKIPLNFSILFLVSWSGMTASHLPSTHLPSTRTEPSTSVRLVPEHEVPWFDEQLAAHHYLGAGRPVGDYLRQIVEVHGRPAALLVWGPSCYALKDRDLWISWSAAQRVERLKLIVQNRRFLLLAAKGQSPNLASQTMGAALRALPEHWRERFGYRPLLAESFTDPESHAGTCYKASNWEPVGHSAGYRRHRAGTLPQALAMDGKMIRDHIGLLTLAQHEDGAPQAMAVYDKKENTPRCEQTAAQGLLDSLPALDGKLMTADALHCQRPTARLLVEKGGDYLVQIKGNQPRLLQRAQALDALSGTPFLSKPNPGTAASRSAGSTPWRSSR